MLMNFKGSTMVVVKTNTEWVFGGYAEDSWNSDGDFYGSSGSFIFTLTNPIITNPSTKYSHNKNFCLSGNPRQGPAFGNGYDFCISNKSNKNSNSFSYMCSYTDGIVEGQSLIGKALHFPRSRSVFDEIVVDVNF